MFNITVKKLYSQINSGELMLFAITLKYEVITHTQNGVATPQSHIEKSSPNFSQLVVLNLRYTTQMMAKFTNLNFSPKVIAFSSLAAMRLISWRMYFIKGIFTFAFTSTIFCSMFYSSLFLTIKFPPICFVVLYYMI